MRFGLFIPQGWRMDLVGIDPEQHWGVMAGLAERADALDGWSSIWVFDHFHTIPEPSHEATHEAWTLMAAFAAATSRVRIGQMCTCMSYRNPAYLAKIAATVDIVSAGRLEMGIGAGWYEDEWRAYGYGFPSAGERLARLGEGVEIFRQLWTTGESTFAGEHYRTDRALCWPRPLQGTSLPGSRANGIPMWIAGGGEKKTLRIAAEYADVANFTGELEAFRHKREVLHQHCRDIGRDPDEIALSSDLDVVIGGDEDEVAERLAGIESRLVEGGARPERVARHMAGVRSGPLVGTVEQVSENLEALRRSGQDYPLLKFAEAAYDVTGLQRFEAEVMPEFLDPEDPDLDD